MAKPIVLNREKAKSNPEAAFAHPQEVADHVLLTYAEKLTILDRWRGDILCELAASADGMATQGVSSQRLKVLEAVDETRRTLEAEHRSIADEA